MNTFDWRAPTRPTNLRRLLPQNSPAPRQRIAGGLAAIDRKASHALYAIRSSSFTFLWRPDDGHVRFRLPPHRAALVNASAPLGYLWSSPDDQRNTQSQIHIIHAEGGVDLVHKWGWVDRGRRHGVCEA